MVLLPDHLDDCYSKNSEEARTGGLLIVEKHIWDNKQPWEASYYIDAFNDLLDWLIDTYDFDEASENVLAPNTNVVPDMRKFLDAISKDPRFELGACPNCLPNTACDYR